MDIVRMIGLALLSGLGGYAGGLQLAIFLEDDALFKDAKGGAFVNGPFVALLGGIAGVIFYAYSQIQPTL